MKDLKAARKRAEKKYAGWIRAHSGGKFYPTDPREKDIHIEDIAHALSNLCRYTGHCSEFYSVAQHSCLVAYVLPHPLKLWGLLHDAAEAYIGDLASPTKVLPEMAGFRRMEARIMQEVVKKFKLDPKVEPQEVKLADKAVLLTEAKVLGLHPETWGINYVEPAAISVQPWEAWYAEEAFLDLYKLYTQGR